MSGESPRNPEYRPGLTVGSGGLDRALAEDLEKIKVDSMLAREDAVADLTRDLEQNMAANLELTELHGALDRLEGSAVPKFSELEDLLVTREMAGFEIEKNLLTDLLRDGGETQSILKRGIAFLKARRYPQAIEWWSLHRAGLDPRTSRLHLLLLIMECLTYFWADHEDRMEATREQIRSHPLYRR